MYSLNSLKSVLLALLMPAASATLQADEYSDVLYSILSSNRGLKSERAMVDAERSENMTGLNLANPEVEFAYQWGTPGSSPDKKILDVSQSFDFATLSGGKRRVASGRNVVAERNYMASRMSVAGDIDRQMTEAVYLTKMATLYMVTDTLMSQFEHASYNRLQKGDMTAIEYNMVLMQRRNSVTDIALNRIEIETVMSELSRLAGGEMPIWQPTEYCAWSVPADIAGWVSTAAGIAPEVSVARAESELAADEVSLRRKEGLPSFSLGYTSEMIRDDNHFGVSVGVELPLWGNHGRVKAAKAAAAAAAVRLDDIQYM
ncbi:MAG: TolC family protein, partial [Muribaculaceae bacterium]|nr:TolC family protein [Muribaculaceae bacterium]MDE6294744.1 TolC family protein [Muribaculaceae bacterium]